MNYAKLSLRGIGTTFAILFFAQEGYGMPPSSSTGMPINHPFVRLPSPSLQPLPPLSSSFHMPPLSSSFHLPFSEEANDDGTEEADLGYEYEELPPLPPLDYETLSGVTPPHYETMPGGYAAASEFIPHYEAHHGGYEAYPSIVQMPLPLPHVLPPISVQHHRRILDVHHGRHHERIIDEQEQIFIPSPTRSSLMPYTPVPRSAYYDTTLQDPSILQMSHPLLPVSAHNTWEEQEHFMPPPPSYAESTSYPSVRHEVEVFEDREPAADSESSKMAEERSRKRKANMAPTSAESENPKPKAPTSAEPEAPKSKKLRVQTNANASEKQHQPQRILMVPPPSAAATQKHQPQRILMVPPPSTASNQAPVSSIPKSSTAQTTPLLEILKKHLDAKQQKQVSDQSSSAPSVPQEAKTLKNKKIVGDENSKTSEKSTREPKVLASSKPEVPKPRTVPAGSTQQDRQWTFVTPKLPKPSTAQTSFNPRENVQRQTPEELEKRYANFIAGRDRHLNELTAQERREVLLVLKANIERNLPTHANMDLLIILMSQMRSCLLYLYGDINNFEQLKFINQYLAMTEGLLKQEKNLSEKEILKDYFISMIKGGLAFYEQMYHQMQQSYRYDFFYFFIEVFNVYHVYLDVPVHLDISVMNSFTFSSAFIDDFLQFISTSKFNNSSQLQNIVKYFSERKQIKSNEIMALERLREQALEKERKRGKEKAVAREKDLEQERAIVKEKAVVRELEDEKRTAAMVRALEKERKREKALEKEKAVVREKALEEAKTQEEKKALGIQDILSIVQQDIARNSPMPTDLLTAEIWSCLFYLRGDIVNFEHLKSINRNVALAKGRSEDEIFKNYVIALLETSTILYSHLLPLQRQTFFHFFTHIFIANHLIYIDMLDIRRFIFSQPFLDEFLKFIDDTDLTEVKNSPILQHIVELLRTQRSKTPWE